ncbi:LPS-assembly protein LptD [Aquincola sp. S2]|uniref:LPS-assembly protein LptD n=1 Tax=Pseudaquabacterium terrae TaxID=2732868 RepID=A0ABX2EAX6_9BURK|nr:LPS-assembly protein LptD [Aquabacterium terrae]
MHAVPLAVLALAAAGARAQAPVPVPAPSAPLAPMALKPSTQLTPTPRGDQVRQRPILLQADELRARPDLDAVAEGDVQFRRAGTFIRADRLTYDSPEDLAVARGQVRIEREGSIYRGPELQLKVQRFEGFFLQPEFEFLQLGSGGRADRVDFIDSSRSRLTNALYSSCPRDGSQDPDWLLTTSRIRLDMEANEGLAEGAVLRFLGVPILGAPVLSFPLSDDRKTGWLPPDIGLSSRSGFEFGVPYYWNIAPNRDATFTPTLLTRRGLAGTAQFRYLELHDSGQLQLHLLPRDRVAERSRHAWTFEHDGNRADWRYKAFLFRVSDDAYWEDFPKQIHSFTPRLLPLDVQGERVLQTPFGPGLAYARLLNWQVLTAKDPTAAIVAPYQRSPQLGLRLEPTLPGRLHGVLETELNRFTRPSVGGVKDDALTGWRAHALGQVSRRFGSAGWWLTPKLTLNAASYATDQPMSDGARHASRVIPTYSTEGGMVFERPSRWFGQAMRQTLEPRLLYANTPYRDQSRLPNFDSADRDFNVVTLFDDKTFSGIDRVADAHQLTAGVVTRLVHAASGAELLRLGLAQRLLFRDQRVTVPPAGQPLTSRVSNLLLDGATSLLPGWTLDAAFEYNPDTRRTVRSNATVLYQPGPFRTISANYLLTRGLSEQLGVGWQWPIYRGTARPVGASGGCGGTLYAVGRLNYSLQDSRMTGLIAGVEYDAGCWIGRLVAERQSTARNRATTQLSLQLELVGLSRLGSNALQVLKDNIPGYRLLRDPHGVPPPIADPSGP